MLDSHDCLHTVGDEMRIVNTSDHAYPHLNPAPLTIDNFHHSSLDAMSQHRIADEHHTTRMALSITHDPPRAPVSYSNSSANVSHNERPASDPTTIRSLLSAPHHSHAEWRSAHSQEHRNGDHVAERRDGQDGQAQGFQSTETQPHADLLFQPEQSSSSKRKLDETAEQSQNKMRRTIREHLTIDCARVMSMTTVICLHAAVAQKSYGSEKRFLCPPPVVRIETPYSELKNQQLSMCIVTENGDRGSDQRSPLDSNMIASFKYLHVAGTAKSKSFQLALDIAEPPVPNTSDNNTSTNTDAAPGRVWASFDSAPVTIISKPSKKTAKTRNISSCILAGGPVSLFNRINSQTVRTKYMTIEHAQLCASNLSWSAFNVNVLRRHSDSSTCSSGPQPVTYGSEIQLVDSLTNITTNPLIIRKVDKGKVSPDDGGPVSQMQKIALQRVNPDGSRSYLSAASPIPGASMPGAPTPGSAGQPASHPLLFQAARVRDELRDGVRIVTDEVDDYLCWTIVGISKFQYTFFDGARQNTPVPHVPITPFPTLFTAPAYRVAPHTIELTVSNFFYQHPDTLVSTPLEVWLGNMGPLRQRIFQATPPGPLTSVSSYGSGTVPTDSPQVIQAAASGDMQPGNTHQVIIAPPRFIPSGPLHTIVIVDLPPIPEIVKTIQDSMASLPTAGGSRTEPRRDARADGGAVSEHRLAEAGSLPSGRLQAALAGGGSPHTALSGPGLERSDNNIPSPNSSSGLPNPAATTITNNANDHLSSVPTGPAPTYGTHGGTLSNRALPLLFIRGSDGMGYHSGRSIACDHAYLSADGGVHNRSPVDGGRSSADGAVWIAPGPAPPPGNAGWSLRVI